MHLRQTGQADPTCLAGFTFKFAAGQLLAILLRGIQMKSRWILQAHRINAIATLLLTVGLAATTEARVTRITLAAQQQSAAQSITRGSLEQHGYEVLHGKAYGEVDPADPHNAVIQDIGLAPRNARGRVEYVATFTLTRPKDRSKLSHILSYEVVNRGASGLPKDFSSGDIFLESGWQGDIPFGGLSIYGTPGETVQVPVARNRDGSPITGSVLARFSNVNPGTTTLAIRAATGYSSSGTPPLPVDLDTSKAVLTSRVFEDLQGTEGGVRTVPSAEWAWADCNNSEFPGKLDPTKICVKGGFRSDLLYQLVYTAKDPLVLGVGMAAMRDVVSYFRNEERDDNGTPNPIASDIHYVIARGASQSGNAIRTFLNLGFNQDEHDRRVWDGAMPLIAARQTPVNLRFAVPGGASNLYEPGSDGVVWWADSPDRQRRHEVSGLLHRCEASKSCPKIIEVLGSSEFWALRLSPDFVGTSGELDIPLPPNVRRYYVASTQHGGGGGGFQWAADVPSARAPAKPQSPIVSQPCVLPPNPNSMSEINSALQRALERWVVEGKEPPASKYPTLANGHLVSEPSLVQRFPLIPGVPSPAGVANPMLVYELGDGFNYNDLSGVISIQPPRVIGVLNTMLPDINEDGNEIGGIQTVLQAAPLGTYLGWNVTASGFFKGRYCGLAGSYIPFARTKAERIANHDSRLSLEERYGTHEGYVKRVREAASTAVQEGFLLPEDGERMVREATESDVLLK